MARPQLPKPRGLSGLLAALAWTLLLAGRCSTAAPLPNSEATTAPPKVSPNGPQWAAGHFLGKKSIVDEQNEMLDHVKRLQEDARWEEAVKTQS